MIIKNIMWDVDGVLANLDHAYYRLLTEHPKFRDAYKGLEFSRLRDALPIDPKFGSLELKTHPTLGKELDHEFCHNSGDIYFDRPLYPNVKEVLVELDRRGYFQLTMSAGFCAETKRKAISDTLKGLDFITIEVVEHAKDKCALGMIGEKEARILECLNKYNLKPEETVLVDDRIFNSQTALNVGMHAVRCRPGITTDTPPDLKAKLVAEVKNILEFRNWLLENTSMGEST